jgi:hypothetical protein
MSKHWIKSNSVLVAVDLPDYQGSDRRGLSLIGLNDSFGFSVNIPRNTAGQIGSQKSSVDDPSFAPDISFDLSFIPTRTFSNENSLGFNFGFNSEYTSVFSGRNDTSFNVYLFISDKQSYDLIKQIRDQQSLNGIECLAIGSCYVNQYGLSIKVGDFARSSCSFIGSNLEASVVSSDKVKVPAINLENGTQGDYYLSLDWPQISAALDEITIAQMPLLPTTEVKFTAILNNLEIPSAVITPLSDAKIQSLDFGLTIPRETSYGFGSNFPRGRKIKYPVEGQLNISTIVSNFSSGSFSGMMAGEQKYNAQLNFLDPQDLFLSGKSFAELSGFLATGVSGATGFFTESRSLKIENAKLNSYSQSAPLNDFMSANMSFSFKCHESGGLMQKFGVLSEAAQPYYLYSADAKKLIDASGDILTVDPYLYVYGSDCSLNYLIDGNGDLMLADNWGEENNACPYSIEPPPPTPPSTAPEPAPIITSIVDNTTSVDMVWSASDFATGYQVQISEDGGFAYDNILAGVTALTGYSDVSVPRGNESYYYYRIVARNDIGSTTGDGSIIYIP